MSQEEWNASVAGMDTELEREDEEIDARMREVNQDTKYWVTEYKVTSVGDDENLTVVNSTEVIGLATAEELVEKLESLYENKDDILVYLEDYDDKGILATE